jgi:hypothetical protein
MNRSTALGLLNRWSVAVEAQLANACVRVGRYLRLYAISHCQKSARSCDRRIARHAQMASGKSRKMIVSAAFIRLSMTSYGPKSPSMIQDEFCISRFWMRAHSSGGNACSPDCQNILSSSMTGRPVISPKVRAREDLPAAARPKMTTRSISSSLLGGSEDVSPAFRTFRLDGSCSGPAERGAPAKNSRSSFRLASG